MEPSRRWVTGPAGAVSVLEWAGDPDLEPILFLHPVNTAAEIWSDLVPILAPRRCVAPDFRGHGMSDRVGPFLPVDFAADVLAVASSLDLTSAVLVGGSIGGAVAMEVAAARPALATGVAFVGAALHFGVSEQAIEDMAVQFRQVGVDAWFAGQGSSIVGPRASAAVPDQISRICGGRSADVVHELLLDTFVRADSRATARSVRNNQELSYLVATGDHDPTCPPAMASAIADLLDVEAVLLAGVGHVPMLEAPDELADVLRPFLDEIDHRGSPIRHPPID